MISSKSRHHQKWLAIWLFSWYKTGYLNKTFYDKGETLSFPESVVTFFQGELGQPVGGFPKELQRIILKDRPAFTERPGAFAEPVDFEKVKAELAEKIGYQPKTEEVLSYLMYPQSLFRLPKSI